MLLRLMSRRIKNWGVAIFVCSFIIIATGIFACIFDLSATGRVGSRTGSHMASLSGIQIIIVGLLVLVMGALAYFDEKKREKED